MRPQSRYATTNTHRPRAKVPTTMRRMRETIFVYGTPCSTTEHNITSPIGCLVQWYDSCLGSQSSPAGIGTKDTRPMGRARSRSAAKRTTCRTLRGQTTHITNFFLCRALLSSLQLRPYEPYDATPEHRLRKRTGWHAAKRNPSEKLYSRQIGTVF